eukprot:2543753-Pyramimonas_sp.AAC.1
MKRSLWGQVHGFHEEAPPDRDPTNYHKVKTCQGCGDIVRVVKIAAHDVPRSDKKLKVSDEELQHLQASVFERRHIFMRR